MTAYWNEQRIVRLACAAVFLAIFGYGAFLRAHVLAESLYDEEILTREIATQPALHVAMDQDFPLYYLLAGASLALGDTEAALRLPSFAAGMLSIAAVFILLLRVHSRTAGLVGAAIIAFAPFHIHYSTFARPWALMMLLALLTLWCLYTLLERGREGAWIAFTLSACLALAAHAAFAPALIMMSIGAVCYLLLDRGRGPLKQRAIWACLLALCTTAAFAPVMLKESRHGNMLDGIALATVGDIVEGAALEGAERPLGGGLAITDPARGTTRYRLTLFDCVEYLKTFYWNNTTWLWTLLLVVGVWGFADLWFRVPALAAPLSFGLLVAPLPLFFLTNTHWYHVRYMAYASLFSVVFVAAGLCVLPRFLARVAASPRSIRLWRRRADDVPARPLALVNLLYSAIIVVTLAASAPIMNEAYVTYPVDGYLPRGPLVENRAPVRDWKKLVQAAAPFVREGDHFLYMTPAYEHGPRYTRYYFSRFLSWGEETSHVRERFGAPAPELLQALANAHPMANLWFAGYQNYNAESFIPVFEAAGAAQYDFSKYNVLKGLRLFVMGAPTTNLAPNGSFEERLRKKLPEGVEKSREGAPIGLYAIKMVREAKAAAAGPYHRIPIAPASYRLRNNGFEAWRDGLPAGWTGNHAAKQAVALETSGFEGGRSLTIAPAHEPAVLAQRIAAGLAPGRTIEVQAMGLSHESANLHLVVRFAGPGYQEEARATHPGSGAWERMTVETSVPADADPASITVEIWRGAGGVADVAVDNVELRINGAGANLDPEKDYVVSLSARADFGGAPAQGSVRLVWVDADGKTGKRDLIEIDRSSGWRRLSATFQPGDVLPAEVRELYLEAGLEGGPGTLWIDGVQVEEGTQPTPFTLTFRLPHDEALASRDLAPHAVTVPW